MTRLGNKEKGFTLVELLVVIAIIAVLAAIAIPQFTKFRLRGYKAGLDTDAQNIYTAAQAYLMENPSDTIDTRAKVNEGGYRPSADVGWTSGDMQLASGSIHVYSQTLKTQGLDNNAQVYFNGRVSLPAQP